MNLRLFVLATIALLLSSGSTMAQRFLSGQVKNEQGIPIASVNIAWKGLPGGTTTNEKGSFQIPLPPKGDSLVILFSHIGYRKKEVFIDGFSNYIEVILEQTSEVLPEISVSEARYSSPSVFTSIPSKSIRSYVSPSAEFLSIIKSLPGVVANNELSSAYQVRGGNLDENLVLLNGIPIYRPFIISNGQQEGLSFIVPWFVDKVHFYSGAWQAKFGGRMSSVLDIEYRRPEKPELHIDAGLLGANLYAGSTKGDFSYFISSRYKSTRYLLNTFEVNGQYLPRFADIQSLISWQPGARLKADVLIAFSDNSYFLKPTDRYTDFGSFSNVLRLFVAFDGQENLAYTTGQIATRLSYSVSERWKTELVTSGVQTFEREYSELEGGYRLCDVQGNPGADDFGECLSLRGIGTQYNHRRNELDALLGDIRFSNIIISNDENSTWEWGYQLGMYDIYDLTDEYSFLDSAGYVTNLAFAEAENEIKHAVHSAFVQVRTDFSNGRILETGLRLSRPQLTGEWLLAPRVHFLMPAKIGSKMANLHFGLGVHYQNPFYREFRRSDGTADLDDVRSQKSIHATIGSNIQLLIWDRPFNFKAEAYHKYMWDLAPYEIDNVRIRYLTGQWINGRASGLDARLGGEFIKGTESWISLGILNTRETSLSESTIMVRRPSDQRVTMGMFFQDHLPSNPDMKVAFNLQFGSGLPFGPPGDGTNRTPFTGAMYRRLDIAFTRDIRKEKAIWSATAEILNVLGADNTITYTWIGDVTGQDIAIPNSLTARFFNLKLGYTLN